MKVLSLFDGISACHLALERAGHKVDKYYTSEIDKYAEQISMYHYPEAIRLGDVTKWESWDIDWASIDLVTGGFPCQAWSVAGKQMGDKDPRGMLFWTMLDIMKTVMTHNPKAKFLMENVKMKKEFEQYITHHTEQALGHVEKHLINSALVSAQNRQRYYWTNIEGIEQPSDRGLVLADVIESGYVDRENAYCIDANYHKGGNLEHYLNKSRRQLVFERPCEPKVLCGRVVGRKINPETGKRDDYNPDLITEQRLETRPDEKSGALTTVQKDNVVVNECATSTGKAYNGVSYRKLTPLECERLQTFPDGWTECVSSTQRYKSLGNAWTVDVIAHIFSFMIEE